MTSNRKWILIGGGLLVLVVGFLLFRPDTLFTDIRVDESLESAFAATTSPEPGTTEPPITAPSVATTQQSEPTTAVASQPLTLSVGRFTGIDHRASGTVTIYEQDGQQVLRFEDDTDIQNGPDLYVWVLASPNYEGGTPTEYMDLGTLKGNLGGQNYVLPAEFDPEIHRTVLIWCLRFAVPFAAAQLS